jgi:hypothetical protein
VTNEREKAIGITFKLGIENKTLPNPKMNIPTIQL